MRIFLCYALKLGVRSDIYFHEIHKITRRQWQWVPHINNNNYLEKSYLLRFARLQTQCWCVFFYYTKNNLLPTEPIEIEPLTCRKYPLSSTFSTLISQQSKRAEIKRPQSSLQPLLLFPYRFRCCLLHNPAIAVPHHNNNNKLKYEEKK